MYFCQQVSSSQKVSEAKPVAATVDDDFGDFEEDDPKFKSRLYFYYHKFLSIL